MAEGWCGPTGAAVACAGGRCGGAAVSPAGCRPRQPADYGRCQPRGGGAAAAGPAAVVALAAAVAVAVHGHRCGCEGYDAVAAAAADGVALFRPPVTPKETVYNLLRCWSN